MKTLRALLILAFTGSLFAQPVEETVLVGTRVPFVATADGNPAPSFDWLKDGVKVASGATFVIEAAAESDSGTYTVRATNTEGTALSDTYKLTAQQPPPTTNTPPQGAPMFTLNPSSQEAPIGGSLTFTVAVTGNPTPTLQWYQSDVPIPGATATSWTRNPVTIEDGNTLIRAVATNSLGSASSGVAAFWINFNQPPPPQPALAAPVFTQQPADAIAELGHALTLTVMVTGNPAPTLQWRKDGANLAGATTMAYSIASVSSATVAGEYSVNATNSQGTAISRSAFVTVRETAPAGVPPVIVQAPLNLTVPKKATARFEVVANSTTPMTYQWKKGTSNIIGATKSVLVLTNVNPSSAGTYTVTVTNPDGAVNTSAKLTVR